MRKRILSLICVFLFMAPLVPVPARAESYTSPSTYWSWLGSLNPILQKLLGHAGVSSNGISYLRLGVCPDSDDSRHHASSCVLKYEIPGLLDTGYYECVCSECGQLFRAYEQDLQEAYEEYVAEELPAPVYNSDGMFRIDVTGWVGYPLNSNYSYAWQAYDVPSFQIAEVNPKITNNMHFQQSESLTSSSFVLPYSGQWNLFFPEFDLNRYVSSFPVKFELRRFDSEKDSFVLVKSFSVSRKQLSDSSAVFYSSESTLELEAGEYMFKFYPQACFSIAPATDEDEPIACHMSAYGVICFNSLPIQNLQDTTLTDSYSKSTRPTAISGAYGVIDGDGNIQRVESTSIVNEDDHTVYNPVTNTTHGITDWTYNYDNRSYDITADDGSTLTVTYGNDNVTIIEPGGTYNVYYLSEQADPTPTPAHDHNYTSAVTREPTCTLAGIRTYTCSECDATYTESIPATGHAWGVKQQVQTQYDDTGQLIQQGYTIYRCAICEEEYKSADGTAPPNDTNISGGSGGQTDDGEESGGILGKIGKLLGTAASIPLKIIEAALGKILDGLISLAEMIGDKLSGLVEMILGWFDVIPALFGGFLDFLGVLFGFLPEEMILLLSFGLAALIFIAIWKAVWR